VNTFALYTLQDQEAQMLEWCYEHNWFVYEAEFDSFLQASVLSAERQPDANKHVFSTWNSPLTLSGTTSVVSCAGLVVRIAHLTASLRLETSLFEAVRPTTVTERMMVCLTMHEPAIREQVMRIARIQI
jgi:hypothetical protein